MTLATLLLLSTTAAGELLGPLEYPELPEASTPQCVELALVPGRPPGIPVDRTGHVTCAGQVVPDVRLAHLLQLEVGWDRWAVRYAADVAALQAEVALAGQREAWWRSRAEELEREPRWWRQPGVALVAGVALGAGATVGVAWALPR